MKLTKRQKQQILDQKADLSHLVFMDMRQRCVVCHKSFKSYVEALKHIVETHEDKIESHVFEKLVCHWCHQVIKKK